MARVVLFPGVDAAPKGRRGERITPLARKVMKLEAGHPIAAAMIEQLVDDVLTDREIKGD